ncbi:Invasion protein IalB, involved in pathogenesis [Cribrihabitans marinus]|uniref:Invasion protein IalB, involved in pathogenesis n=1 Tax=Cribrihabitans marinus TaxID=1227549 RepID=A0A1H7E8Y5_9RHOB|nr:invasion associated locus B family protein [Cribrihabitans marinus]GGH17905.1 invasion-associated locus B family protein [Cribrihabitans marinus]SEK07055.1 Invasion protein IalB, involved in pathogenesis [Cribrihabitans marinus]
MIKNLFPACAIGLMVLGGGVAAQDSSDEGATEGAQTPTLDLGQPATDTPQLGSRYAKEEFDDWTLACVKTEGETDPCSMLQILNGDDGNPIAEVSMFRLKNSGPAVAGATVIVPLETLLTAQLTISIDGAPGKRYNYSFCNPVGCIAQIGLTQADIDAMKRGKQATVSLVPAPAPDQKIDLALSLSGFTAAFDAVDVVEN